MDEGQKRDLLGAGTAEGGKKDDPGQSGGDGQEPGSEETGPGRGMTVMGMLYMRGTRAAAGARRVGAIEVDLDAFRHGARKGSTEKTCDQRPDQGQKNDQMIHGPQPLMR